MKMKKSMQSLMNLMIIGNLFLISSVYCANFNNKQFLSLPRYQEEPLFFQPYQEPIQEFYTPPNVRPPPLPYGSYYSPFQPLQNYKKYNPPQTLNPQRNYQIPSIASLRQPNTFPQFSIFKTRPQADQNTLNKNLENPFGSRNSCKAKENDQLFYLDDFNKNYTDEDYSDNYSDEVSPQPEPYDVNSPYRYFQPDSSNPNTETASRHPGMQPQLFAIYGFKTPITLLPSKFPPRLEEFLQRVQNYFSTYVEKETEKPLNETQPTSTFSSSNATSETEVPIQQENYGMQHPLKVNVELEVQAGMSPSGGNLVKLNTDVQLPTGAGNGTNATTIEPLDGQNITDKLNETDATTETTPCMGTGCDNETNTGGEAAPITEGMPKVQNINTENIEEEHTIQPPHYTTTYVPVITTQTEGPLLS